MADRKAHNNWQSPQWLVSLIANMAPIGLDPCTTAYNPTGAARFFTAHDNGLRYTWSGRGLVYCNPPFSLPLVRHFTGKMIVESETFAPGDAGLLLLPGKTDTKVYHAAMKSCQLALLFDKRFQFEGEVGGQQPMFGCALFGFWSHHRLWHPRFCETFKGHGTIVMVESKTYFEAGGEDGKFE